MNKRGCVGVNEHRQFKLGQKVILLHKGDRSRGSIVVSFGVNTGSELFYLIANMGQELSFVNK